MSVVAQVRIGARNDAGTWTDSAWQNLDSGWNGLEINYQAAHNAGSFNLWVGGTLKATLSAIDNDGSKIDSVCLGAQGVDTGTRGTIYFNDFESRRFSEIGLLPDPGIYGYAAVAHEAKHLEQGPSIANSVEGEWEAFRFGVTVLMNLEGIPSSEEIAVMSETTLQGYYSEVNKQYPGYPIELLPMYPQPNLLMGIYHSCIWRYVIPRFVLLP